MPQRDAPRPRSTRVTRPRRPLPRSPGPRRSPGARAPCDRLHATATTPPADAVRELAPDVGGRAPGATRARRAGAVRGTASAHSAASPRLGRLLDRDAPRPTSRRCRPGRPGRVDTSASRHRRASRPGGPARGRPAPAARARGAGPARRARRAGGCGAQSGAVRPAAAEYMAPRRRHSGSRRAGPDDPARGPPDGPRRRARRRLPATGVLGGAGVGVPAAGALRPAARAPTRRTAAGATSSP